MTEEELQTRLILCSLLPPGSPELDSARRALVLQLLHQSPQEALNFAWKWWDWPKGVRAIPRVSDAAKAILQLPGIRNAYGSPLTNAWLESMLADEACDSGWMATPLQLLSRADWPIDRLLARAERQPSIELLQALAPLCLMPETATELRKELLGLFVRQPLEVLSEVAEHLGREAILFPLAHSRMFVSQAEEILGETMAARMLLRRVREARVVLRLRTRRSCRMRWAPRVDAWLANKPQTEFYKALRQEVAYFNQIVVHPK